MKTVDAFWMAVDTAALRPELAGPHLLPGRLSWAAAHTLQADGAGLSLSATSAIRVPLGASDDLSGIAERLQFTAGEGPCLDAYAGGTSIVADAASMSTLWPVFAGELASQTTFRSIYAAPLPRLGALDVYFHDPVGCLQVDPEHVDAVATQIVQALLERDFVDTVLGGSALNGPDQRRRNKVSIAMGMTSAALQLTFPDALSVLRARAFSQGRSLDDLAADLVDGEESTDCLRG